MLSRNPPIPHQATYFSLLLISTACCPLIVPLLTRPFTQTSSWCLELKYLWLRTFCVPVRDCEAQHRDVQTSFSQGLTTREQVVFLTQISLLAWALGWGKCGGTLMTWILWKAQQTGDLSFLVCRSPPWSSSWFTCSCVEWEGPPTSN